MSLFAELKRRNVLRVAAAYITVSWLLIQVVETLFPVFELSDAAIRNVVILLAIGFGPALIFAWVFELTPEGIVRDSEADHSSPAAKANTKTLDRVIIVSLALAVGYFAVDKFMLDPARDEAREQAIAEAAREEGRAEASDRPTGRPVVAVLPFSALTTTEDSRFFAVGVHDDLLTRLAQLPSMLVISRTSVLEYKDTTKNMRQIGEELGASMLLEGGVQSAGNRIRINAQLIDAKTDEHLWAETYDRELTAESIFEVQDDIAKAIADALHVTLTAADTSSPAPTTSMAAYRAFHEAIELRDSLAGGHQRPEYQEKLLEVLELDPNYTRPRAELVGSLSFNAFSSRDAEKIAAAEYHLGIIKSIAPDSVEYLFAQAFFAYYAMRDYDLAHDLATAAHARAPSDVGILEVKNWIERRQGDFAARVESLRTLRTLQPLSPASTARVVYQLLMNHEFDELEQELETYGTTSSTAAYAQALLDFRVHGATARLRDDLEQIERNQADSDAWYIWAARIIDRDFEAAEAVLEEFEPRTLIDENSHIGMSGWARARAATYFFQGRKEKAKPIAEEVEQEARKALAEIEHAGPWPNLTYALTHVYRGDNDEAERYIQAWYQTGGQDWANRVGYRQLTCNILGLASKAKAAVDCIREGLSEPSEMIPFLETRLPYYDSIRDEPVFQELVAELEAN